MSEHLPDFGFEPDDDGFVEFMTVQSDFVVTNFQEYMLFMRKLVEIAEDNPDIMPIYRPGNGQ